MDIVSTVRNIAYMNQHEISMESDIDKNFFIIIRNCLFARLAACNARRVSEVTCLKLQVMEDGLNGVCFNHNKIISTSHFDVYVPCKNSPAFVSLIIPT